MAFLIHSSDVYKETNLSISNGQCSVTLIADNIGLLPTLYSESGEFNHQANSYLFYQKAVKQAVDLQPCAQALKVLLMWSVVAKTCQSKNHICRCNQIKCWLLA